MRKRSLTVVDRKTHFIELAEHIVDQGYELANLSGRALSLEGAINLLGTGWSDNGLAILAKDTEEVSKKRFAGLLKRKSRRRMIATVWLSNGVRSATAKSWVMEVWGADMQPEAAALAKRMIKAFNVKIRLDIMHDRPQHEVFQSDYID